MVILSHHVMTASCRSSQVARPKEPDSSFRGLAGWVSPQDLANGENTSHLDWWLGRFLEGGLSWNGTSPKPGVSMPKYAKMLKF